MYIDLDYFMVTEAEMTFSHKGRVEIQIKAQAEVSAELYSEWTKKKENEVDIKLKYKEITDG